MLAPTRWPFAAHWPRKPGIGGRGHAGGLFTTFRRGLAALRREISPSDQDLDTWLTDHDPFP